MQRPPSSRSRKPSSITTPTKLVAHPRSRGRVLAEYRRAVDTAIRELSIIESTAMPAYREALDRTDLDPTARALEVRRAALRVEHLLGVVEDTLRGLWESRWFGDRVIAMLLAQLEALRARVERVDERSLPVVARGTPATGVSPAGPRRR